MDNKKTLFTTLPHDLFISKLRNGEREFFCFICFSNGSIEPAKYFSWKITSSRNNTTFVSGERLVADKEREKGQVSISALLPAEFEGGELQVKYASYEETWKIQTYSQKSKFRLPLDGQVLVLVGHHIGEIHRSAKSHRNNLHGTCYHFTMTVCACSGDLFQKILRHRILRGSVNRFWRLQKVLSFMPLMGLTI